MTDTEIAWLAGVLEGEACFSFNVHPKDGKRSPKISISLSDRDIVARIAALVGLPDGRIHGRDMGTGKLGPHKRQYTLNICGHHAAQVLRQILPWMGERRTAKIQELLAVASAPWSKR